MVGAFEALEETVRDGKEGHMFYIGVVFGRIRDDVVDIVTSLPPAQAETAKEIPNEDSNTGVDVEGVRDAHMTGIMCGEDELVPEPSKAEC